MLFSCLCVDPEAGVAEALAHIHQWYSGSESHQWESLSEQHDHPEAAQWGGVWFLQRSDDPGQGQTPKGQVQMTCHTCHNYRPCLWSCWGVVGKIIVVISLFFFSLAVCATNFPKYSSYASLSWYVRRTKSQYSWSVYFDNWVQFSSL